MNQHSPEAQRFAAAARELLEPLADDPPELREARAALACSLVRRHSWQLADQLENFLRPMFRVH